MASRKIYYLLRPFIPRWLQIYARRKVVLRKRKIFEDVWPIDKSAGKSPDGWYGWPEKKTFALMLMHDVDTQVGHDRCLQLADIEEKLGFRSVFNFVPERYAVAQLIRQELTGRGFQVGVHGLNHDGKLFSNKSLFAERAVRINRYLKAWGAEGFTSPAMHHNLDWMSALNIKYATSTFDTDPFEPQPDGVRTIFPFWAPRNSWPNGYLEIPYTLPQDFTMFVLMKERNIDIWKKKLAWIADRGGMALVNTHSDYMCFSKRKRKIDEYPVEYYKEFLEHIKEAHKDRYWHALPSQMTDYWISDVIKKGDRH